MVTNTYELLENGNTTGWEARANSINGYNAQGMTPLQVSVAAGDMEDFAAISKDPTVKPLLKTKTGSSVYGLAARGIAQRNNIGFDAALQTEEYQTLKKSINYLASSLLKKNKPEILGGSADESKILKEYLDAAEKDPISPAQLKTIIAFEGQQLTTDRDRGPVIEKLRNALENKVQVSNQPSKQP